MKQKIASTSLENTPYMQKKNYKKISKFLKRRANDATYGCLYQDYEF